MPYVQISYSDGHYDARRIENDAEGRGLEAEGRAAFVDGRVLAAWEHHCGESASWHRLWRSIENEHYVREREKKLQPLEGAQREIERLTWERDQAKRMWKHFESEYEAAAGLTEDRWHTQEARNCNDYTCVMVLDNSQIEALPPEWQKRGRKLLDQKDKEPQCCCGRKHRKLDGAKHARLSRAGFLVMQPDPDEALQTGE